MKLTETEENLVTISILLAAKKFGKPTITLGEIIDFIKEVLDLKEGEKLEL